MDLIGEFLTTSTTNSSNRSQTNNTVITNLNGKSVSYVTMITDDSYFPGVQALIKTLRKYSRVQITVIASISVSKGVITRITQLADTVIEVPNISSSESNSKAHWNNSQYTKLNIWNLSQFDKIIYLDADCIAMTCIDELFGLESNFSASPDIFPPDKFNAGVLVIKPDTEIYHQMLTVVDKLPSYDGGDTGFLNAFYHNWYFEDTNQRLPFSYNAQRTMYWFTHEKQSLYWESIQPIKIIHFSSTPKPWTSSPSSSSSSGFKLGDLEMIWWGEYMS